MTQADVLDEVYDRLHVSGPEFSGWLSNHGPMAADALIRLGHGDEALPWASAYARRLHARPDPRWALDELDWQDPLGDASRLGDWCALLERQVSEEPWEAVLARWWPRLLPGAVASATHGLIRTGHAVRALSERVTEPRLAELGQALGYWAARWQPLPQPVRGRPVASAAAALDAVPASAAAGGIRTRLRQLEQDPGWRAALGLVPPVLEPADVPRRLDELVDAAVLRYGRWGHAAPVMLVHAATAPRAVGLVLPALPEQLWLASYATAWAVTAAVAGAYRPREAAPEPAADDLSVDAVTELAVASRDEHAIKFTEVAVESHRRGNTSALAIVARAVPLIAAD
ncbi:MAG: questin oxidase family protein [Actinobacteria bacterium]|nr:questin oxidase family protein [Actinomycetota bacterium]